MRKASTRKIYIDRTRTSQIADFFFKNPESCPHCLRPWSSSLEDCRLTLSARSDEYFHVCDDCFYIMKHINKEKKLDFPLFDSKHGISCRE